MMLLCTCIYFDQNLNALLFGRNDGNLITYVYDMNDLKTIFKLHFHNNLLLCHNISNFDENELSIPTPFG